MFQETSKRIKKQDFLRFVQRDLITLKGAGALKHTKKPTQE